MNPIFGSIHIVFLKKLGSNFFFQGGLSRFSEDLGEALSFLRLRRDNLQTGEEERLEIIQYENSTCVRNVRQG